MSYNFGVDLDSKHVPSYADEGRARRAAGYLRNQGVTLRLALHVLAR